MEHAVYRASHLLMDLGRVNFYLGVPPSCPATQPLLPNYHHPRKNWADSGTLKIQVNPTHVHKQMGHPVESIALHQEFARAIQLPDCIGAGMEKSAMRAHKD